MSEFGINVFDFGAKGDGVTDDTAAIQSAIDFTAKRGGGKILFPYTNKGYRIASAGIEEYNGMPVRSQLVIPSGTINIELVGEMPCRLLNSYQVRPLESAKNNYVPTQFRTPICNNTRLFSDWEAPEEHDPTSRPWSILAAPEGKSLKGHFSVSKVTITNLEFAVYLNTDKMYPTESAVNLQNVSRAQVRDSQFCLNQHVGDTVLGKELLHNPCHTVGLMMSGDQNDHNVLENVAVQGFRYGFVLGENVVGNYLYVHNCEEAITFHDSSHLSVINRIHAQHNTVIISTTREKLFGHEKGPCFVEIGNINMENGDNLMPRINALKVAVLDEDDRLVGSVKWHQPWGNKRFPVVGATRFKVTEFGT